MPDVIDACAVHSALAEVYEQDEPHSAGKQT